MRLLSARRVVFWGAFFIFVCVAFATHLTDEFWQFQGPVGFTRAMILAVWIGFTSYSIYCIPHESLWRSAQEILRLFWGRQVTADLYISVGLSIGLVWLVTGSILETLLWSLAFLPFANLAILLFIALHVPEILGGFGVA